MPLKIVPFRLGFALALIALVASFAAACGGPKTPEEAVADARSRFTAELSSFSVRETPLAPPEPAAAEADAGAVATSMAAAEEAAEGEEGEMEEEVEVPVRTDVILDFLVQLSRGEGLPGLTLDVSQADGSGNEKASWLVYLDTSKVLGGQSTQIAHTLEGVDYIDGDGFYAEVRANVPAAEQSAYREYAEAAQAN